ncbi:MAG: hypothetical protein JXA07_10370 [Spirochaetes bacterium]|nr:hypothetical protein [Spirochaetota bacterium]
MTRKLIFIIIANLFIALVLVQTYLRPFRDMILSGAEQKTRPEITSFRDATTGKFQGAVEKWLKQNIGFRGYFVKTDNQINYSIFNEFSRSHPRKIILGKQKQLFEEAYIDTYNRLCVSPESALEKKATSIKKLQGLLGRKKVQFLLILTPSKASVYPEYIPEKYILRTNLQKKDNYQRILPYLEKYGVNLLDGRAYFLDLKKRGVPDLFPSSGTHWSLYGGYVFAGALIERMERLLGRHLVRIGSDRDVISGEPIELDKDIARLGNILFTRSLFTEYRYPVTRPDTGNNAYRPNVLLVGSSFCWNILYYLDINNICSKINFYYYFNTDYSYPNKKRSPIRKEEINWDRELLARDLVIIEINESQIDEAGFGFIEKCLQGMGY